MNKFLTSSTPAILLLTILSINGCGGSGDGGTRVPANAVLIADSTTAETTTTSALTTGNSYIAAVGIEASTTVTGKDIFNAVQDKINSITSNSTPVATGVTFDEPCSDSGSISGEGTETSGSFNFNACNDGSIIIDGTVSANGDFNFNGPYSLNMSGNLTITDINSGEVIGFHDFNFSGSGNNSTGDYTVTTFTYVIAPSSGGGFLAELTQPIVGNDFDVSCDIHSGQILVTGAEGSQARGTINPDRTLKVEYHRGDGNFIVSDNSPLACP